MGPLKLLNVTVVSHVLSWTLFIKWITLKFGVSSVESQTLKTWHGCSVICQSNSDHRLSPTESVFSFLKTNRKMMNCNNLWMWRRKTKSQVRRMRLFSRVRWRTEAEASWVKAGGLSLEITARRLIFNWIPFNLDDINDIDASTSFRWTFSGLSVLLSAKVCMN